MLWRIAKRASDLFLAGIVVSIPVALTIVAPVLAVSGDTNVGAVICGGNSTGARIDVTEPSSDTVVNQPIVTLRGTVEHATLIEVTVDGAYESTVPLSDNQTTFAFDITLPEGTHTIELTANDVCQVENASDSLVVTYEAVNEPSDGGSTPTTIDNGGGIVVNPEAAQPESASETSPIEAVFGISSLSAPFSKFASTSGLDATLKDGGVFAGVSRIALTVTALSTIVLASVVAPLVIQSVPGIASALGGSGVGGLGRTAWIIRGGGLLLMAFAYLI